MKNHYLVGNDQNNNIGVLTVKIDTNEMDTEHASNIIAGISKSKLTLLLAEDFCVEVETVRIIETKVNIGTRGTFIVVKIKYQDDCGDEIDDELTLTKTWVY